MAPQLVVCVCDDLRPKLRGPWLAFASAQRTSRPEGVMKGEPVLMPRCLVLGSCWLFGLGSTRFAASWGHDYPSTRHEVFSTRFVRRVP